MKTQKFITKIFIKLLRIKENIFIKTSRLAKLISQSIILIIFKSLKIKKIIIIINKFII